MRNKYICCTKAGKKGPLQCMGTGKVLIRTRLCIILSGHSALISLPADLSLRWSHVTYEAFMLL